MTHHFLMVFFVSSRTFSKSILFFFLSVRLSFEGVPGRCIPMSRLVSLFLSFQKHPAIAIICLEFQPVISKSQRGRSWGIKMLCFFLFSFVLFLKVALVVKYVMVLRLGLLIQAGLGLICSQPTCYLGLQVNLPCPARVPILLLGKSSLPQYYFFSLGGRGSFLNLHLSNFD